jgi:hypothetical protein
MIRIRNVAVVWIFVGLTWLALAMARDDYAQHPSLATLVRWTVFYLAGVISPWIWWFRHRRLLRTLGLTDPRLQEVLAAPLVAGGLTFLFGLSLLMRSPR